MKHHNISAPYIHHWNTASFNDNILIGILSLVILWATILHGIAVLAICISGFLGLFLAWIIRKFIFKFNGQHKEIILSGLLLIMIFPITTPLYIPFFILFFTCIIFFVFFGGKENNYINIPAFGALFAYVSWPGIFTNMVIYNNETLSDAFSKATPITILQTYSNTTTVSKNSLSILQELGIKISSIDKSITDFLNTVFFNEFKSTLPYGFFDFIFGLRSNTIIESGLFILFIGLILLFSISYYKYLTSFSAFVVCIALVWIFGIGLPGEDIFHGDILFSTVNYGIVISLFYYNIFPEYNCVKKLGQIAIGVLTGLLAYVCIRFRSTTEGMFFVLCTINIIVILCKNKQINTFIQEDNYYYE